MMPISPYYPAFNYRRNTHNFPYTSKNVAMHINPSAYSPSSSSIHNTVKNNGKNYSHINNFHSANMLENSSFSNCEKQDSEKKVEIKEDDENRSYEQFFEIFGIKLFFDDLLILALLFFLYKEDVNDSYLFIVLFMLLLS